MKTEAGITRNRIFAELLKAPHGDLEQYVRIGQEAASREPEFLAHLIAWNWKHGKVRDSKNALPVVSLSVPGYPFTENSIAHLAKLDPRNLCKALELAETLKIPGYRRAVKRMVTSYLRARESHWEWFESQFIQHRASIKRLYAMFHVKPLEPAVENLVFPGGSLKHRRVRKLLPIGPALTVEMLGELSPMEAARLIEKHRIPFLIATGALRKNSKSPEVAAALLRSMTPKEVVTNTKAMKFLGIETDPVMRSIYEEKLAAVSQSGVDFKVTRAAQVLSDKGDVELSGKLHASQERQLAALSGFDGSAIVLGDRSRSMEACIEGAIVVATTLTKAVKGKVHLIFFDDSPIYFDATGKSYEELMAKTSRLGVGGATSIGCGLQRALDEKLESDLIAIVSDAQENTEPNFAGRYERYCQTFAKEPPVYLFRFPPGIRGRGDVDLAESMKAAGQELQEFPCDGSDYTSLPNFVHLMKASRYSLMQDVFETPLLTLDEALAWKEKVIGASI